MKFLIKLLVISLAIVIVAPSFAFATITWYSPAYDNEPLGHAGSLVTVRVASGAGAVYYANFTWRNSSGVIVHSSGLVPSGSNVITSNSFTVSEKGTWTIEVQFYNPTKNPIAAENESRTFIVTNKIEISASPFIILNGASNSTITANVTDGSGNPVSNNVVNFTTDLGNLSNGTASGTSLNITTDVDGIARVNVSSTTKGTAIVTAVEEEGGSDSTYIAIGVNYVVVSATPEDILADGTMNSTINASVTNITSNAVDNNIVNFTISPTNLGTLSNGTVSGVTTLTAMTNGNGVANVTLTPSGPTGIATITAVEEEDGYASVTVSVGTIITYSDGHLNITQSVFPQGQEVHVKAVGLSAKRSYKFKWYNESGSPVNESEWLTGSTNHTDFWRLPSNASIITWRVQLVRRKGGGINESVGEKTFTVVQPA
ncbi:MAG: Ig-like domain-containing protein, partial [Candidatus Hydrothermarchaeales archaeon]